jgi:DNA-binding protein HU-alpha
VLRKKELFERVVEVTGAKKKDVKPIVEATLKALGDALSAGDQLVLPPLGKAKVNQQKDLGSAEMLVIRLRRQDEKPAEATADGGADAE